MFLANEAMDFQLQGESNKIRLTHEAASLILHLCKSRPLFSEGGSHGEIYIASYDNGFVDRDDRVRGAFDIVRKDDSLCGSTRSGGRV